MGLLSQHRRHVIRGIAIAYSFLLWRFVGMVLGATTRLIVELWWRVRRPLAFAFWAAVTAVAAPYWLLHTQRVIGSIVPPSPWVVASIFAIGIALAGAASVVYVAFLFLDTLVRNQQRAALPLRIHTAAAAPVAGKNGGGQVYEYSEEEAYVREAVERARREGVMTVAPEDIDEYLKRRPGVHGGA